VLVVLLVHAVVGTGLLLRARTDRVAALVALVAPVAALAWWAVHLHTVLDGGAVEEAHQWVPTLDLVVDLRFDGFAALMVAIVSGIGVAVFLYSWSYFGPDLHLGRVMGLLTLFSGAMLGVVLADNLILLYGFWELTSVTSFLLIGDRYRDAAARSAALQAILVTGAGGLAMLLGFVILGVEAGTYRLSTILADPPAGAAVTAALALIAVGAFTKSAQYPFHSWLPAAMVAPTPISAYLHSATMVKAGVYLVARMAPAFAVVATGWRPLVVVVGSVSMLAGAARALRQHDLKLLLAFGTISQLGFMMVLFGVGLEATSVAGCAVILAHALFKATLFMVVGIVDHGTGTRDVRHLPHLGAGWRTTKVVAVVAAASMAGVPLTFGFVAKELGFEGMLHAPMAGNGLVLGVLVLGSALTAAYAARFVAGLLGAFRAGSTPGVPAGSPTAPAARADHPPGRVFLAPPAMLGALTVVFGVAPSLLDGLESAAASSLSGVPVDTHLAVWHGLNTALGLSAVALLGGGLLFVWRASVERVLALGSALPTGSDGYHASVSGLLRGADRVTGVVQSGSMPVYLGVILVTTMVLPGTALLLDAPWDGWPRLIDSWVQVALVAVLLSVAVGAAVVRHRLSAALLLGVSGYAMAGLFVVQGAPDLALTQAAVETLSTVLFVLALRRLPSRFERRSTPATRSLRLAVSAIVGITVFGFALAASSDVAPREVADEIVERALPDGHGRNVVNVILVDFRGLDTLGEISVVAVAAIGAVALARAGRRPRAAPRPSTSGPSGTPRHAFVEVVVRGLVYITVTVSLFLLMAGHNDPGGGFVGGLVAGAAVALRYISGGLDDVRRMVRARPWTILGSGLLLAAATATVPLLFGQPVLENAYWELSLPLLGEIAFTSGLIFDTGVYLVVVGLVFMVFEAFGGETIREPDPDTLPEDDIRPADDGDAGVLTPAGAAPEEVR
jgi:multicomponent Na+:H+ antiporter subunit A